MTIRAVLFLALGFCLGVFQLQVILLHNEIRALKSDVISLEGDIQKLAQASKDNSEAILHVDNVLEIHTDALRVLVKAAK